MSEPAAPPLPEEAQRQLLRLAADVLGRLPEAGLPVSLRRVQAFTPARRADAGSGALSVALERDPVFRQQVAAAWRAVNPELAEALADGQIPAAADPTAVLVGLHVVRGSGWVELAQRASTAACRPAQAEGEEQPPPAAAGPGDGASELSTRLLKERDEARAQARDLAQAVADLRREARRLRSDADRARAAARAVQAQLEQAQAMAADAERGHERTAARLEARLAEANESLAALRKGEREGRSLADVRLRLLLDTVLEAAAGLRRELALPPQTATPADFLASQWCGPANGPGAVVPVRAQAADDPAVLDRLLALPRTHLIVDGYNVTKSGYGDLPLLDQRRRLVDGLGALQARTQAEVTCCFDGADVAGTSRTRRRGVRVLFSEPGTTADELVRRLVRAEPPGRPVVVVSSDQEVASGVRAAGARCVPATALLRLLAR